MIHDYLLVNKKIITCGSSKECSRDEARYVFAKALKVLNCPRWKFCLLIAGVGIRDFYVKRVMYVFL